MVARSPTVIEVGIIRNGLVFPIGKILAAPAQYTVIIDKIAQTTNTQK